MLKRLSLEEKRKAAQTLGAADRPINVIIELTKPNGAPEYSSTSLRQRSKETVAARATRFSKLAQRMGTKV